MSTVLPTQLPDGPRAVATRGLSKQFGRQRTLDGVDLAVPEGAIYVLVGPNGAGKTTTLRILLDLVRADGGTAEVFGLDTRARAAHVRAQIGYVPERHDTPYGWMRVGRLLEHHATYFPTWDADYAAHLSRVLEIRTDKRFGTLSKGQARRVQLLLALAHRPPLLLLDEPTDGLDPVIRDEVLGLLVEHVAECPTTMLISTHLVHEVDRLADHFGAMRDGRLVAQVERATLQTRLRRYRMDVPEQWAGAPALNGSVVRRAGHGRDVQWTVWGEEGEVARHLSAAGATVREAAPLTLEESALALLSRKD